MNEQDVFAKLEEQYSAQIPFVAYRKPNENVVNAILQDDKSIYKVKDFTENGFVFSPFDNREEAILFPLEKCKTLSFESTFFSETSNTNARDLNKKFINNVDNEQEQHIKLVEKGIKAIHNKRFEKVVLSRVKDVPISEENPFNIFKSLLETYKTAFVYIWFHPQIGMWFGATPETLLNIKGQRFTTMSLAGTQPYNGSLDIKWDAKNINEQQLVTNFVLESLQPFVEKLEALNVQTIKAGQLLHLQSRINGVLKSNHLNRVILAVHPTPAVCGLPKTDAKDFILQNENYDREFYTGFLGELNFKVSKSRNTNRRNVENNAYNSVKTSSELFVNLRCMQMKDQHMLIYVGGGVTKDSIAQLEWEETVNKTQTMLGALFN
nr:chorismate-binding protein [uncultured Psychroserpens sp.]